MRVVLLLFVLGCGGVSPSEESNRIAQAEDGDVCLADNVDMLAKGWTRNQLQEWCVDPEKWHERMIADKCRDCPECCVIISD